MKRFLAALAIFIAACTASPGVTTIEETTTTSTTTSTTTTTTTATTVPEVRICPVPPYTIGFLPPLEHDPDFDDSDVEPDVWTSVGGTQSSFVGRPDGSVAIALIRGTLPAVDWPGEKGIVEIDGVDAAVGPHADGTWVAGWYLEPAERCDLYTMVFYPPWNPNDVRDVLLSMTRVPG